VNTVCEFGATKVVAGVRSSTLLPNIRPQKTRQFASAPQINQLEGLAVARPWGFVSPLPHYQSKSKNQRSDLVMLLDMRYDFGILR